MKTVLHKELVLKSQCLFKVIPLAYLKEVLENPH